MEPSLLGKRLQKNFVPHMGRGLKGKILYIFYEAKVMISPRFLK